MPNYLKQIPPDNPELASGLKGLYDKLEAFYLKNQNDIDAILTATDVAPFLKAGKVTLSAIPFLGIKKTPFQLKESLMEKLLMNLGLKKPSIDRRREIYSKLLAIDPYKPVSLIRFQAEPGPDFTSHISRGGIFVAPSNADRRVVAYMLPREAVKKSKNVVEKTVTFENPLVINSSLIANKFSEKQVKPKTLKKLLKLAMQNIEGSERPAYQREEIARTLVLRDLIAAHLAERAGFDAIIARPDIALYEYKGPKEIMLLPSKRKGDRIIR